MIKKICRPFFIFAFLFSVVSCYGSWNFWYEGNDVDVRTKELLNITETTDQKFADSNLANLGGKYTVLIISDTHFGNTKKAVNTEILFNWLDSIQGTSDYPVFAINLGDVTDLGRRDHFEQYTEFCKTLTKKYNMKIIFNVCGNHDAYQNNWENWMRDCYPHTSFYRFQTKNFSWYCLDTASGTIGIKQYYLLHSALENDSRQKIIFTHYPFVRSTLDCANMAETTERNLLLSDFVENNVKCVLGGHNHEKSFDDIGFPDYGLPSFAYDNEWGLLHVDEDTGVVSLDFVGEKNKDSLLDPDTHINPELNLPLGD